jgi:hypothetical protein
MWKGELASQKLLTTGQNLTMFRREIVTVFALHSINGTGKLRLQFRNQFVKLDRIMKAPNQGKPDSQALKERFLQCFGARANNATALQDVVKKLIDHGVPRKTLVAWAVEADFSRSHIASVLSRIFVALGLRERQKGAGRRPSPAALELLAHARSQYGENFLRVLYAACRAGKTQLAATNSQSETSQSSLKPNCASTIRRFIQPAGQSNGRRYPSTTITFKRTFKPVKGISNKNRGPL